MSIPPSSSDCSSVPNNGSTSTKVITTLTAKIRKLDADSVRYSKPNIIKVPVDIRKDHGDAYEPRLLFIGPYHRNPSPMEEVKLLYLKDHDDAYEPKLLFIGTHHRKPSPMEEVKLLYLKDLMSRDENHNKLSHYVEEILKLESKARMEYSDPIELSNEEFVEMLVVDGCFIIEFLLKRAEGKKSENDPAIFSQVRTSPTLRRDLLLLENQIPFFILDKILQMSNYNIPNFPKATTTEGTTTQGTTTEGTTTEGTTTQGKTLIDFALPYLTKERRLTKDKLMGGYRKEENIYHLLHLSYLCLMEGLSPQEKTTDTNLYKNFKVYISRWVSSIRYRVYMVLILFLYFTVHALALLFFWRKPSWSVSSETDPKKPRMIPTATELKEAGVTFKKKKNSNNCYLNVSFDKEGYFKIPLLPIQENTNSVFRNFLAFEQSCPKVGNNFTSYVVLMDNLIDTPSDVAVLKRRGILESKLGSDDDVARLFNQMRSGLCFDFENHYLKDMFQDINDYCNREHNRWRAKLMHDYLGNPWAFISVIAAVALLGLTTVQAIYSVLSFKK